MASINGFKLKKVKTHRGHEGEPLDEADIYYNETKIGEYTAGDWGGPCNINIPDKSIYKLLVEVNNKWFSKYNHGIIPDEYDMLKMYANNPEGIILELLGLRDIEKTATNNMKKYPGSCYVLYLNANNELYYKTIKNDDSEIRKSISNHKVIFLARSSSSFDLSV